LFEVEGHGVGLTGTRAGALHSNRSIIGKEKGSVDSRAKIAKIIKRGEMKKTIAKERCQRGELGPGLMRMECSTSLT